MRDYQVAIAIKEKEHGNRYSRSVLETGYMDVNKAIDEANKVMHDKFGVTDQLEMTRGHRKRRDR